MSPSTPRRPASSRGAVNRPRKIAGQSAVTPTDDTPVPEPKAATTTATTAPPTADDVEVAPSSRDDAPRPDKETAPVLASPAATRMLVRILAVLAVVLLLQAVWWVRHTWFVDEPAEPSEASGAIAVPADRPVVENELAWKEGVAVAGEAVQTMMTRSYETYDADVDKAAEFLTADFAEEFRSTTDDVKQEFVGKEAVMSVDLRAQAVVRANDAELQALVMFDQTTVTTAGPEPKTVTSEFRALVTLVHTDQGWFVDRIDAS
ncbi:Mce-associated membrane protein [Nocardioides thalensis]|uniref:Mce-associated membrane protein n=1 Tax=Nocardioides thalensis TaxID=1914755 RepID=A0A853C0P2_9ACTN|nr:hypothetical protein [Nocardioides thalensis]NYJ01125.1 Mce-associated membrane protein [Nocardioides thalensis]